MKHSIRATIVALFALALLSPLRAQDADLAKLHDQAAAGDAKAQYALGNRYFRGRGAPQNYAEALSWYRQSADQGLAAAQGQLGYMSEHGLGVPRDYARAMIWYRTAAEQGDAFAQFNLGSMYENGRGVRKDYGQAAQLFRKAAEQGNPDAEEELGLFPGITREPTREIVTRNRISASCTSTAWV